MAAFRVLPSPEFPMSPGRGQPLERVGSTAGGRARGDAAEPGPSRVIPRDLRKIMTGPRPAAAREWSLPSRIAISANRGGPIRPGHEGCGSGIPRRRGTPGTRPMTNGAPDSRTRKAPAGGWKWRVRTKSALWSGRERADSEPRGADGETPLGRPLHVAKGIRAAKYHLLGPPTRSVPNRIKIPSRRGAETDTASGIASDAGSGPPRARCLPSPDTPGGPPIRMSPSQSRIAKPRHWHRSREPERRHL